MPPDTKPHPPVDNSYSRALERRLAMPVLVSAIVSVPAIFLGQWGEGAWSEVGHWANRLAGFLLWAEWILLIVLAEDKLGWLRTHKWSTFVAAVTVPAVILFLGPAQVLRLIQVAATLRLLRLTRIIEAGGVLRRRMGLTGPSAAVVAFATAILSVVFAGAILADPASASHQFARTALDRFGPWPLGLAAAALLLGAAAVLALRRWKRVRADASEQPEHAEHTGDAEPSESAESPELSENTELSKQTLSEEPQSSP